MLHVHPREHWREGVSMWFQHACENPLGALTVHQRLEPTQHQLDLRQHRSPDSAFVPDNAAIPVIIPLSLITLLLPVACYKFLFCARDAKTLVCPEDCAVLNKADALQLSVCLRHAALTLSPLVTCGPVASGSHIDQHMSRCSVDLHVYWIVIWLCTAVTRRHII